MKRCNTDWYVNENNRKPAGSQNWIFYTFPDRFFIKSQNLPFNKAEKSAGSAAETILNQSAIILFPFPYIFNKQKTRAFNINPDGTLTPMTVRKYNNPHNKDLPGFLIHDINTLKKKAKFRRSLVKR